MTLAHTLLQALKSFGAKQAWGIPGDFILPFFREMEQSQILPVYSLSHEPCVAFAADASARLHDGIGVLAVTYGAGALNSVNAVAQAYAERSPLVVLAGMPSQSEMELGLQLHHQVKSIDSQVHIFKEITCAQVRLDDVNSAADKIARVLQICKEQSQPVLIEIPRNMSSVACDDLVINVTKEEPKLTATDKCLADIESLITNAQRPVVIAGVEVKRYDLEEQLCSWVNTLDVPCFTTLMGTGIAAELPNSPVKGTYLGEAGDPSIAAVVEQSDLVILVGAILSDSNFAISAETLSRTKAIFIEHREVNLGHYSYHGIALKTVLSQLATSAKPKNWDFHLPHHVEERIHSDVPEGVIAPMMIADALNRCFEQYGRLPVASDVGDCLFVSQGLRNTAVIAPGYYASMGFGVPAGFGIQATTGRRPVVLVGDGAFQMTGMELGHCRRYGFTPIIVLLNNQGWEMIRAFAPDSQAADLGLWPFADMATHFGGVGKRVSTPDDLQQALNSAFEDPSQFYLIDVQIPKGCMTPSLAHFAKVLTSKQNMARA
ncbi:indolepyruvate/phenylpyruvate decarboxylase [Pseudoalteromonas sp. T1lg23B]|uniref:indolepyruvate/phenylpyruvate decarboxylase n=1 Tax=Pseudoalteromonas sp. T1lg23B TaxID=2077097 RepID=UPI000CF605A4|nr:indolepyruvate/phenylpyruvate decarboxylase [Pseudoalteromonas sp. T1lg23B]